MNNTENILIKEKYQISSKILQDLLLYLNNKPYGEVNFLFASLIKRIQEENSLEISKEKLEK